MPMDTGFSGSDAASDFSRARRTPGDGQPRAPACAASPTTSTCILPFDEVVAALGRRGERRLGLQTIDLDSIVGTVDRTREFDRQLPPHLAQRARSAGSGSRRRCAAARRCRRSTSTGSASLHFVSDGHHRVSVARAAGPRGDRGLRHRDHHRRRRRRRRPAPRSPAEEPRAAVLRARPAAAGAARRGSCCRDGSWYAGLAEGVEAWGFRVDAGAAASS